MSNFELILKELQRINQRLEKIEKVVLSSPISSNFETVTVAKRTSDFLHAIGIPNHLSSYQYLKTAIIMVIEEPNLAKSVNKHLCPAIAEQYATTPSLAYRGIRYAIEIAFTQGNIAMLDELFTFTKSKKNGRATPCVFISTVADYLRNQ